MSKTSDNYINSAALSAARTSVGNKEKVNVPMLGNGSVGVRATLNNMGIDNSLIGFDEGSKTVTLGGKAFMRPSYIDEGAGVSYASPGDIQKSLVSFYSGSSNPVVRVTDAYAKYAGDYGLSADAISYGNGTVSVGGQPLNILYTDDEGKSWAFDSDVKNAAMSYINSLGVQKPGEIFDYYSRKYLTPINNLARSVANRDDFKYDPEDDPVYRAYKNQYLTQGARASENTMANYAALTGGYANSAALTAAAQTNQYYMSQLTNQIPELAQAAYERYADKYSTDIDLINSMADTFDKAYGAAYSANNKMLSNANNSASSNTKRDENSYQKYWDSLFNAQQYSRNDLDSYWTNEQNAQDYRWTDLLNTQKSEQNIQNIQGTQLDNIQKEIYLRYYDSIVRAQLNNLLLGR